MTPVTNKKNFPTECSFRSDWLDNINVHLKKLLYFIALYCTSMVWVFPEEVCPYAKIVPLYPYRTSMRKTGGQMRPQHIYVKYLTCLDEAIPPYLWQSAWHRCCTPVPGWCWSGTLDQTNRTSPAETMTNNKQLNTKDKKLFISKLSQDIEITQRFKGNSLILDTGISDWNLKRAIEWQSTLMLYCIKKKYLTHNLFKTAILL